MQTSKLSVGTQRFYGAHKPVSVVRVLPCRPVSAIKAPLRPLAVLSSGTSSTSAVDKATTQQAPANPVKETWAKVQGLVKNTAKVAAILGVALALVSITTEIWSSVIFLHVIMGNGIACAAAWTLLAAAFSCT
jgi:hypothetical protein